MRLANENSRPAANTVSSSSSARVKRPDLRFGNPAHLLSPPLAHSWNPLKILWRTTISDGGPWIAEKVPGSRRKEKKVWEEGSPNSSRGSTWPRAGNAAWSALTPGLAGSLLNCSLLTMLPISPCFPSRHASYLTMIPILPCVTSDHVSHLAMPNCSHLTKNYCARLPWYHHGRVDGLAFYQSGLFWGEPHFWQEWPDLKGIFGMKAFCQETRQDSGHSQAARRARQGSSWTATKQK